MEACCKTWNNLRLMDTSHFFCNRARWYNLCRRHARTSRSIRHGNTPYQAIIRGKKNKRSPATSSTPHVSLTIIDLLFLVVKCQFFLIQSHCLFQSHLISSPEQFVSPFPKWTDSILNQGVSGSCLHMFLCMLNHMKSQLIYTYIGYSSPFLFPLIPDVYAWILSNPHDFPQLPQLHGPSCPTALARLQWHVGRWTSTEARGQGCGIRDFLLSKEWVRWFNGLVYMGVS